MTVVVLVRFRWQRFFKSLVKKFRSKTIQNWCVSVFNSWSYSSSLGSCPQLLLMEVCLLFLSSFRFFLGRIKWDGWRCDRLRRCSYKYINTLKIFKTVRKCIKRPLLKIIMGFRMLFITVYADRKLHLKFGMIL